LVGECLPPGRNARCQNRPLLHRGQLLSSLTTRLAAANGAASALSRVGLPMQAVPALSALLIRRARPSPPASPRTGRPRRHATERGTRQDQPQSRQTLSYSAASQSTRIIPMYPPASGRARYGCGTRPPASGGNDGMVQVWDVSPFTNPYATLCTDVGPPTRQEWDQYAPGEPLPQICA